MGRFDVCIVGAGLVGLGVARALTKHFDGIAVAILEKEDGVARHQSGHNSGVIHSGLYYRPGSLKARLCVAGREAVYRLCDEAGIDHRRSGKLVIATSDAELAVLDELERRGIANGLSGTRRLGPSQIRDIEPEATGLSALHVPEAGVVDFKALAHHIAQELVESGVLLETDSPVTAIEQRQGTVRVTAGEHVLTANLLINCAGLHSDRVASLAGVESSVRIIPFRGEYYRLDSVASHLVKGLIYPVPDPRFPFLGVHFTRRIDGTVEVGPNAVMALGREHYRGTKVNWRDLRETIRSRGFRKLVRHHWRAGLRELRSSRSTRRYASLARGLVPALNDTHLLPGGSGVRAQAVTDDGALVDDFVIQRLGSTVHVLNAPSPGATASLAIGEHISHEVADLLR